MNELESLIELLNRHLVDLHQRMDRVYWDKFLSDLEALAPGVDAALDAVQPGDPKQMPTPEQILALNGALSALKGVCGRHPVSDILPKVLDSRQGTNTRIPQAPGTSVTEVDSLLRQRLLDLTKLGRRLDDENARERREQDKRKEKREDK